MGCAVTDAIGYELITHKPCIIAILHEHRRGFCLVGALYYIANKKRNFRVLIYS